MTKIPEMYYNAYKIYFYGEPDMEGTNESPEFVLQHTNQQPANVPNCGDNPLVLRTVATMEDDITRLTMQIQELLVELEGIRIQLQTQKNNHAVLCKICYQKDVSACASPCEHVFWLAYFPASCGAVRVFLFFLFLNA